MLGAAQTSKMRRKMTSQISIWKVSVWILEGFRVHLEGFKTLRNQHEAPGTTGGRRKLKTNKRASEMMTKTGFKKNIRSAFPFT